MYLNINIIIQFINNHLYTNLILNYLYFSYNISLFINFLIISHPSIPRPKKKYTTNRGYFTLIYTLMQQSHHD